MEKRLEPKTSRSEAGREKVRQKGRGAKWTGYIPLMVIVLLTLSAACAEQRSFASGWQWMSWMHDFMGFFLVVFSMFKLFNLEGFADGFQMYDLLAKPVVLSLPPTLFESENGTETGATCQGFA